MTLLTRILGVAVLSVLIAGSQASADPYADAVNALSRHDFQTAYDILLPFAEQGEARAQVAIAALLECDGCVSQENGLAAAMWWRRAADQGVADAQEKIGSFYFVGLYEYPKSSVDAARWFRLAAEQGYAKAQYALAVLYGTGDGVIQDYVVAHMWLNLAAAQGHEDAVRTLDQVTKLMTQSQIEEAQRLAREWLQLHPQQ